MWKWQREGKGKDLYQRAGESYRDFIKRVKDVKSQKRVVSAGEKFADWLKTNYGSNKKIDKRMKELIFESGIEITEGNARTYLTKNNKSLLNKVRTSGVLNIPQMPEGKVFKNYGMKGIKHLGRRHPGEKEISLLIIINLFWLKKLNLKKEIIYPQMN